jgi:hypothetical protein
MTDCLATREKPLTECVQPDKWSAERRISHRVAFGDIGSGACGIRPQWNDCQHNGMTDFLRAPLLQGFVLFPWSNGGPAAGILCSRPSAQTAAGARATVRRREADLIKHYQVVEWGFCLRGVLEAESFGKMVERGVDLTVGGIDGIGASRRRLGVRLMNQAGEWAEQTQPKLDQQHAKFQPDWGQAVASAPSDALEETFRAELAQVVTELAEAVIVADEAMAASLRPAATTTPDQGMALATATTATRDHQVAATVVTRRRVIATNDTASSSAGLPWYSSDGGVTWRTILGQPVHAVTSTGCGVLLGRTGLELSCDGPTQAMVCGSIRSDHYDPGRTENQAHRS